MQRKTFIAEVGYSRGAFLPDDVRLVDRLVEPDRFEALYDGQCRVLSYAAGAEVPEPGDLIRVRTPSGVPDSGLIRFDPFLMLATHVGWTRDLALVTVLRVKIVPLHL